MVRAGWPAVSTALGSTCAVIACLLHAWSRQPGVTSGVTVLLGSAWAAMHSSLRAWATEVLPAARATVVSLFAGALFAGSATASVPAAGLADAGEYGRIFAVAGPAAVPLGLVATLGRLRWRGPS